MVQQNYVLRLALGRSAFEPAGPREVTSDEALATFPSDSNIILPEDVTQQYDDQGHPVNRESRDAVRRLRRAQNNVYSTIGLLVPTTSSSSQPTQTSRRTRSDGAPADASSLPAALSEEQRQQLECDELEEWSSLCLSIGCDALSLTAAAFIRNHRKRIQTFSMYAGQPLVKIALTEWRHQSILSYWLAGEAAIWAERAAEVAFRLVMLAAPELSGSLLAYFTNGRYPSGKSWSESSSPAKYLMARGLEKGVTAMMFIALAPFSAIIALQRLQLIPANDLIPMPWQYSIRGAYLALLPPIPSAWTALFPVFVAPISRYVRALLPRPDNPDNESVVETEAGEDPRWYLQGLFHHQNSVKDELASDLQWIGKNLTYYYYRFRNFLAPEDVRKHRERMLDTFRGARRYPVQDLFDESQQIIRDLQESHLTESERSQRYVRLRMIESSIAEHVRAAQNPSNESSPAGRQGLQTFLEHAQRELDRTIRGLRSSSPSPPGESGPEHAQEHSESRRPANGPLNSHPIPSSSTSPPSPVSSSPPSSPPLEPTNVQVRTRAGSTSTLHMDVEINRAAVDGTTYTTSFSASPRTPVIETAVSQVITETNIAGDGTGDWKSNGRPHHRVSPMSLLPSEILGTIVEQLTVQLLWLPLESLYLRSLARGYYAAVMPARVASVYPNGAWFGDVGLSQSRQRLKFTYAANILLCLGTELWIDAGCWALASTVGFWMGRRWFQWGNL